MQQQWSSTREKKKTTTKRHVLCWLRLLLGAIHCYKACHKNGLQPGEACLRVRPGLGAVYCHKALCNDGHQLGRKEHLELGLGSGAFTVVRHVTTMIISWRKRVWCCYAGAGHIDCLLESSPRWDSLLWRARCSLVQRSSSVCRKEPCNGAQMKWMPLTEWGVLGVRKLKTHLLRTRSWEVSLQKAWSRSEYIHAYFSYCQGFLPSTNVYAPDPMREIDVLREIWGVFFWFPCKILYQRIVV